MTFGSTNTSYDAIVWDWNGTLLDDIDLVMDIVNEIFVNHDMEPMSRQRYQELFDFPVQDYYARAGMDFSVVDYEAVSHQFHDNFLRRMDAVGLFPNALDTLSTIKALGARQFLLSSTEHDRLRSMVAGFEVDHLFDDIQGVADGLARGKTEAGLALLNNHGIDAGRSLMIGDTRHDWEVAQAFGMDCVLMSTGHQSHARLAALGCPVFDTISEIPVYLGSSKSGGRK